MLFVMLAAGLAGCMEDGVDTTDEDDKTPSTGNGTGPGEDPPDPPMEPAGNTTYPREAFWQGCHGFGASFLWVGGNERFDPPPQWEPDAGDGYLHGLTMYGVECERFALGPFARPVKMLLDTAGVDGVPDSCWKDNVTIVFGTLQTVWVNDTEVAQYLRDTYDMPVYYADIQTSREPVGAVSEYVWTMTHEDGAESWFRTVDNGEYNPPLDSLYRWFWFPSQGGLGYMDFGEESTHGNHVTYGHAEPPVTMADWHTDYATTGAILKSLTSSAEIAMFRDVLCQDEIP